MAFTELADLDCGKTTALGGRDKKTGKANPTRVEGYYIGTRQVESAKSKTGFAALHVFQTKDGNLGVWGKTNLDSKMRSVTPGAMARVTFVGMVETKNNPMYKYKVEVDLDNTINVADAIEASADSSDSDYSDSGSDSFASDLDAVGDPESYESSASNVKESAKRATPPSSAAQQRVRDALANRPKAG